MTPPKKIYPSKLLKKRTSFFAYLIKTHILQKKLMRTKKNPLQKKSITKKNPRHKLLTDFEKKTHNIIKNSLHK